jgi:hypothetical protein
LGWEEACAACLGQPAWLFVRQAIDIAVLVGTLI